MEQITLSLINKLKGFEPYGQGNPEPVFVTKNIQIQSVRPVGADGKHLKIGFKESPFEAIGFRMGEKVSELTPGTKVDIAYNIIQDEWNGNQRIELRLRDIKPKK